MQYFGVVDKYGYHVFTCLVEYMAYMVMTVDAYSPTVVTIDGTIIVLTATGPPVYPLGTKETKLPNASEDYLSQK
jgi:hypothetical protein